MDDFSTIPASTPIGEENYKDSFESKLRNFIIKGGVVGGFAIFIFSAVITVIYPDTPYTVILACMALTMNAISSKMEHRHIKRQQQAIIKETGYVADAAQKMATTPEKKEKLWALMWTIIKRHALALRQTNPTWEYITSHICQIAGYCSLLASGVVAFFPDIARFNALLMQVGWALFVGGSQLESSIRNKEKEIIKKENKTIKKVAQEINGDKLTIPKSKNKKSHKSKATDPSLAELDL